MSADRKISEAIQKLAGTHLRDEVVMIEGKVLSVDIEACTCECEMISGEAFIDIPNVRLMSVVDDGILPVPKVGSTVVIIYSKRILPVIIQYGELERIELHGRSVQLNDGSLGGMVTAGALVNKLNAIENLLNGFISLYNSHTHATEGAPTLMLEENTLTETAIADIENTNVTHGR